MELDISIQVEPRYYVRVTSDGSTCDYGPYSYSAACSYLQICREQPLIDNCALIRDASELDAFDWWEPIL